MVKQTGASRHESALDPDAPLLDWSSTSDWFDPRPLHRIHKCLGVKTIRIEPWDLHGIFSAFAFSSHLLAQEKEPLIFPRWFQHVSTGDGRGSCGTGRSGCYACVYHASSMCNALGLKIDRYQLGGESFLHTTVVFSTGGRRGRSKLPACGACVSVRGGLRPFPFLLWMWDTWYLVDRVMLISPVGVSFPPKTGHLLLGGPRDWIVFPPSAPSQGRAKIADSATRLTQTWTLLAPERPDVGRCVIS